MRKTLLLMILLILSIRAFPQQQVTNEISEPVRVWRGNATLNYGSDFEYLGHDGHKWTSYSAGGDASVGYSTKKFSIDISGNISYKYRTYSVTGMTLKTASDTAYDMAFTLKEVQNIRNGCSLKTAWKISPSDVLSFRYIYGIEHDITTNTSFNFSAKLADKEFKGITGSRELLDNTKGRHTARLDYTRQFVKQGRNINAEYEFSFLNESRFSDWLLFDAKVNSLPDGYAFSDTGYVLTTKQYRIMPHLFAYQNRLKVRYSENKIAGVDGLDMDFSIGCLINADRDHQRAATLEGTQWKDSTSYHEDFLFNSITVSPTAHGHYNTGIYTIDALYTPEFYTRKLDDASHTGDYDYGFISHIVNIRNIFDLRKGHGISLVYDRTVKRPGYIQICPFERAGSQYSNVSYSGNPDLMPEAFHKLDFSYSFNRNRFHLSAGIGYEYKFRIIEETYTEEETGIGKKRVYTWINGGYSHTNNIALALDWKGADIRAHIEGKYNYFHGVAMTGNTRLSSDYSVAGDVSYILRTWIFMLRGKYSSKIIRSYRSMNEVVKCDVGVRKQFGKFTVFIEALDLFDRPYEVTTVNADQTEERCEIYRNMSRLFQVGATFKF